MANLTVGYDPAQKPGTLTNYKVKAGAVIFAGALVAIEDSSGFLVRASDTAGLTFAGVALDSGNATGAANGAVSVRVEKTGSYALTFNTVQTSVGKKVYAVDDNTVALAATTTNDLYVGDVVELLPGNKVRVRIDRAVG